MRTLKPIAIVLLALALTGCVVQQPPAVRHTHSPAAPFFKSDAEALAAARKAYLRYTEVQDQILGDGGANPGRLRPFVGASEYRFQLEGYKRAQAMGAHSTGSTTVSRMLLQNYSPYARRSTVTAYVCTDISHVKVFDRAGHSLVHADRPNSIAFLAVFDMAPGSNRVLVVADENTWTKGGVCP